MKKPINEATPLGTKKSSKSSSKKSSRASKKTVDTSHTARVDSIQQINDVPVSAPVVDTSTAAIPPPLVVDTQQKERHIMDVTLTRDTKARKTSAVVYNGTGFTIRLPKSAFIDKNPPETLVVSSDVFAPPRVPKVKLTKEQRAELRKNAPKPTLAEKIAKREAALAKLKAQLSTDAATM